MVMLMEFESREKLSVTGSNLRGLALTAGVDKFHLQGTREFDGTRTARL